MKRLRIKLTAFNTFITGIILLCMTVLCLVLSEKSSRADALRSFDGQFTAATLYLQGQDRLSLHWLEQLESAGNLQITIQDGGAPLFSAGLVPERGGSAAVKAGEIARQEHGMPEKNRLFSCVFPMTEAGESYFAGVAKIPKAKGYLELTCLYPLRDMERGLAHRRFIVGLGSAVAVGLLGLFSWKFTGRMLQPVEQSRREQNQFIAAASHELRTPLTAMHSAASAMERAEGTEKRTFSQVIQREGHRMGRLIGDMLNLASADSGGWRISPKTVEPDVLALELFEASAPQAREKGIKLILDLPEDVPAITADPDRLSQALSILMDNALSYTPVSGRVTLGIRVVGKRLRFTVTDTGPGVPDGEKQRIFQRFYRSEAARSDRNHFGLGLSTASEIVSSHHGRLWVEDNPHGGAMFILELPVK